MFWAEDIVGLLRLFMARFFFFCFYVMRRYLDYLALDWAHDRSRIYEMPGDARGLRACGCVAYETNTIMNCTQKQ